MNLTQTSNKTLSTKLNVDPSLISMWKTGKRKIHNNTNYINTLADFFGKNCISEYQRYSLSDAIGNENIKLISSPSQLSDIIFNWLNSNSGSISDSKKANSRTSSNQGIPPPMSSIDIFYTTDGRRGGISALHQLIRSTPIPNTPFNTLFISIDEDLEWIYDDTDFFKNVQHALFKLINDGIQICHVIHSNIASEQLIEYLKLWIPLYATGKVDLYWCYHPKPQIYQRSIVLAPLSGAVFWNTANTKRDDPTTFLTSDKQLIHSLTYELQSFFPFFKPILEQLTVSQGLLKNEEETYMNLTNKFQQTPSLSVETTPAILIQHCIDQSTTQEQSLLLNSHLMQSARFEYSLKNSDYSYTDIIYLAPAHAIKNGEIKMLVSNGIHEEPVAYTPEMYILHLQNILRLLKHYPNYHAIPSIEKIYYDFILMVYDDKQATIIRTSPPFHSFVIKSHDIVTACQQLLVTERDTYLKHHTRESIISKIQQLITELS